MGCSSPAPDPGGEGHLVWPASALIVPHAGAMRAVAFLFFRGFTRGNGRPAPRSRPERSRREAMYRGEGSRASGETGDQAEP